MTADSIHTAGRARTNGWTLIELLVVITIISILGVVSVPVYRMFGSNDLRDGARTVYTMLRAARVYAMTYNVETAVVYGLDDPLALGPALPDTITDTHVRVIRAAAVMYRLPQEVATHLHAVDGWPPPGIEAGDPRYRYPGDFNKDVNHYMTGTFVPVPRVVGEYVTLPENYAVLLTVPPNRWVNADTDMDAVGELAYQFDHDLPTPGGYLDQYNRLMDLFVFVPAPVNRSEPGLERLGISPVHAHTGAIQREPRHGPFIFEPSATRPYMAHVFTPRGNLKTRFQKQENYQILVAPDPWQHPNDRLIAYPDGSYRLVGIPIEIHRATGRVSMGS